MKILFVNNLQWGDVQGRHHMMYYAAAMEHDCSVLDVHRVLRKVKNIQMHKKPEDFRTANMYPYQYESKLMHWLTKMSYQRTLKDIDTFDLVWIGGPELIRYIPKSYKGKIIYDCMDNYSEITGVAKRKPLILKAEKEAVERAALTLVSSKVLEEHIKNLVPASEPLLVRNGFEGEVMPITYGRGHHSDYNTDDKTDCSISSSTASGTDFHIGFFGAIAKWVNVTLLSENADRNPKITYHLIGRTVSDKIDKDRLVYEGLCPHERLYELIKPYDALVMPFYINDLTRAVDPVKMYEYIAFGKCIISCYYDELERFEPFVYFYQNENEYHALIERLCRENFPPKYDETMQKEFLKENTWKERFKTVEKVLSESY